MRILQEKKERIVNFMEKTKSPKNRMAVNSTASQKEYKQYAKKEKKSSNGVIAKIIMVILLMMIAIVFVCMSGAFNIVEITVEGNEKISKEQIISFSGIEKGTNLFALSKSEIRNKMKENSYIDTVQIKRCLPNKAKLIVKERKMEYALPLANSYVYIDRQGYILEISNKQENVPMILGFTTDLSNVKENDRLEENDLQKMTIVSKIMETAIHQKMENLITRIDISNQEDYVIYLDSEGKIAYLGNGSELNTRFLYIKAILKEQQGKTGRIFADVDLNSEYVYFREEQI